MIDMFLINRNQSVLLIYKQKKSCMPFLPLLKQEAQSVEHPAPPWQRQTNTEVNETVKKLARQF